MDTITVGMNVYAYAEITYTGNGYKLHSRIFDNLDDAEGCMLMYLRQGGMTTTLTGFHSYQVEVKRVREYVKSHYSAEEQILNSHYQNAIMNNQDYHKEYFVPYCTPEPRIRKDLNKLYEYIEEGFSNYTMPLYAQASVSVRHGGHTNQVKLQCDDKESIEALLKMLKGDTEVLI